MVWSDRRMSSTAASPGFIAVVCLVAAGDSSAEKLVTAAFTSARAADSDAG